MAQTTLPFRHYNLLLPDDPFWHATSGNSSESPAHSIHERLVYSYLAYRSRVGDGASARQICGDTTLHPATVKRSLDNLALAGLAVRKDSRWAANEPLPGWFRSRATKHEPKHWTDSLAYMILYLPRPKAKIQYRATNRRFAINHAIIYSCLISFGKKGGVIRRFTFAGFAKLFGLNEKTVKSIVEDLQYVGLIEREDLGRCSDITLLPLTSDHDSLFAPLPAPKKVPKVEKAPRRDPNQYSFKNDGYDAHRRLCQGLMTQEMCSIAINMSRRLGFDYFAFESHLQAAKTQHEKNKLDGKITVGNFGKYFCKRLHSRILDLEKVEKEAQREAVLEAYLNSPEYQKKKDDDKKNAAADPSHPSFITSVDAIMDRVCFNSNAAANQLRCESVYGAIYTKIQWHETIRDLSTQDRMNKIACVRADIVRHALTQLNTYYNQTSLATAQEFEEAVNVAANELYPELGPIFSREKTSD